MSRLPQLVLALALITFPLAADEGFWMPQQIPQLADELKALGLRIDPAQLSDLTGFPMGAVISMGGCSASFVSPQGLIATNHHCVYGALQFNATPENDIIQKGFLAKSTAEEIRATPNSRVYVTTGIDDVTKQILAPFGKKATDRDRARAIERRRRQIVLECEKPGGVRCQVASFFDGAQYVKTTAMEIRDVRLVYAPPLGIGNYGDEEDNWMWPRHTGDFGFLRAYVGKDGQPSDFSKDNVPYQPKHWVKISTRDIDPGDLMLVVGYPGVTSRYDTAEEVENDYTFALPESNRYRRMLLALFEERGRDNREVALRNANRAAGLENYLKKYEGTLEAFRRSDVLSLKHAQEEQIARAIAGDAALEKRYGAARAELSRILAERRKTRQRDLVYAWLTTASPMLDQAFTLYRLSIERTRPDLDRAAGFMESDLPRLRAGLARNRRSFDAGTDRAGLRLMLQEAAKLPADQRIEPLDRMLHATSKETVEQQIDALLDRVYGSSQIGNAEAEERMFEESTKQILARNDSIIAFAVELWRLGSEIAARNERIAGAMSRIRPVMFEALRLARGGRLYPDANSTLRVGFGVVKGYSPRDAVVYEPQTDIRGVVEKDRGVAPFDSPKRLLELAAKRKFGPYEDPELGTLPVAFLTSIPVTNGSSGSATFNAWGELCGLAYDMNWEGVAADYIVEDEFLRTIHVDSRYMLWVMDAVDGANNLLEELGIKPQL
ncbi:MAG: S46 family peptidase [Thermoanaerobaculia bacterium]